MSRAPAPRPRRSRATSVSHGVALAFETLVAGEAQDAPVRAIPDEDALVRVIAGDVVLAMEGQERRLGAGDEAIVPAGTPHRFVAGSGEAVLLSGRRPARR